MAIRVSAAAVIGLALAGPGPGLVSADDASGLSERPDSRFDGLFGVENRRFDDPAAIGADSIWSGVLTLRGLASNHVSTGIDLALGGGPGYYYVARLVVGAGVELPGNGRIAISTGLGVSGLTGDRVGFGVDLPLELEVTLALGARVRPMLLVRPSLVLAEDARQHGTRFGAIDELDATLALAITSAPRALTASGYYIGATYGERLGGRELGLAIGVAVGNVESPASRERERLAKIEAARKVRVRRAELAERTRVADELRHQRRLADAAAQAERNSYLADHPPAPSAPSSWTAQPPTDTTRATVGLVTDDNGIRMVLIIFGEVDDPFGYCFATEPGYDSLGRRTRSSWIHQHTMNGVEAARTVARQIDRSVGKVGAHYEVTIVNGQCSSSNLVR